MGVSHNGESQPLTEDTKKAELLNDSFALVFTTKINQEQTAHKINTDKEGERLQIVISNEYIREFVTNVNVFKVTHLDKIQPWVLKELAEEI